MLSNVNLGQPLFVPLEIHGDIVLGDTPVIDIAVVGDTQTQILEDMDAKDVSNPLFFQTAVNGAVILLQFCRCFTCIEMSVQENL